MVSDCARKVRATRSFIKSERDSAYLDSTGIMIAKIIDRDENKKKELHDKLNSDDQMYAIDFHLDEIKKKLINFISFKRNCLQIIDIFKKGTGSECISGGIKIKLYEYLNKMAEEVDLMFEKFNEENKELIAQIKNVDSFIDKFINLKENHKAFRPSKLQAIYCFIHVNRIRYLIKNHWENKILFSLLSEMEEVLEYIKKQLNIDLNSLDIIFYDAPIEYSCSDKKCESYIIRKD